MLSRSRRTAGARNWNSEITALVAAAVVFLAFLAVFLLLVEASLVIANARVELAHFQSEWYRFRHDAALLKVRHLDELQALSEDVDIDQPGRQPNIFKEPPAGVASGDPRNSLRTLRQSFAEELGYLTQSSTIALFRGTFPEVGDRITTLNDAWRQLDAQLAVLNLPMEASNYEGFEGELELLRDWLEDYSGTHYRAFRILLVLLLIVLLVGVVSVVLNQREFDRARSEEQRSRLLTRHIIQAQEDERERIALDLHDDVAQLMSAAIMELELRPAGSPTALSLLRKATRDLREISYGLSAPELSELGLASAVGSLTRDFSQSTGIGVAVRTYGLDSLRLSQDQNKNIYRILQECLTNTKRHASAKSVEIVLTLSYPHLLVKYQDDGVGMQLDGRHVEETTSRRIGLRGIRERAAFLGAHLQFRTTPGGGFGLLLKVHVDDSSMQEPDLRDSTSLGMPAISGGTN
ncbi:MAG: histidine kinase [Spirochaeta sp.]|nr:histidine kinase [Spirochaeta sp.]